MGAHVVTALQSIVARNVAPLKSSVLTIGKFTSGDRYNVLAGRCEMEGTCRNQDPAIRDMMESRMESIIKGVCEGMGASYTFKYIRGYSPLVVNEDMYELWKETAGEVLGEENVKLVEKQGLGGEDFCFFAEKAPGVFYRLGCEWADKEKMSVHNEKFYPNPDAFQVGQRVMLATALKYLAKN